MATYGLGVDDYLNGSFAGPIVSPALGGGTSPMTVAGAGNQPAARARTVFASSNSAIVLVWVILLVVLVLSHTFTFSLQE